MPTDAGGGGARRWRDAIALYGGGCVPTPATHAPHQRVWGREARKADPTRPWAWTAPPEQRRDKGGFGGKKTFHPKDQPRNAAYSRHPPGLSRPARCRPQPGRMPYTAGAKRPPLVLVCKPRRQPASRRPINRRSPSGLCRPQVLPNGLGMMAMSGGPTPWASRIPRNGQRHRPGRPRPARRPGGRPGRGRRRRGGRSGGTGGPSPAMSRALLSMPRR